MSDERFKPRLKIGPYELKKELGRGAFGSVWLAEHRTELIVRSVALKLPLAETIDYDAFRAEAQIWVQAGDHPNVLRLLTAEIIDHQVVIASQYASGGTLSDWLKNHHGRAPSVDAAVQMVAGILRGLKHLHGKAIIHRDLKPGNVLRQNDEEEPLIADFGLARVLRADGDSGRIAGTPAYMAPEVWTDGDHSFQAEVWAVGVMLYEFLAGSRPFGGAHQAQLRQEILEKEPDNLPTTVSRNIRMIVEKALEKEKARRFLSADDMLQALEPNIAAAKLHHRATYQMRGIGTPKDTKAGIELMKQAAQAGCLESMYEVSIQAGEGPYHSIDEKLAATWCQRAAEAGHSYAMITFGLMHAYGMNGCPQNPQTAEHWLKRAAALNNEQAMWHLAKCSSTDAEAGDWLEKAAVAGHEGAMLNIGRFYKDGTYGRRKDPERASYWLRKAARRQMDGAKEALLDNGFAVIQKIDGGAASPAVVRYVSSEEMGRIVIRFLVGDWGDVTRLWWQENDIVLDKTGEKMVTRATKTIMGIYRLDDQRVVEMVHDLGSTGYGLRLEGESD